MANPLTGDFEAVLQVSGGTVNRLAASMHQNSFVNTKVPSMPHSIWLRIGDTRPIDGVRGTVQAQVGVPHIELIHGVSDRFILEVGVRAHYRADAGSAPLATYIHGTVRAEYRIRDIDPNCFGWSVKSAGKYLWIHVVKDSVRFTGTAQDEQSPVLDIVSVTQTGSAADQAAKEAAITRQVAGLLAKRFAAAPHPVSPRFRRGAMRSLKAPIGGSAVALPLGLNGEPAGQIASINNLLLERSDFAIGVAREYIMSLAEPARDAFNQPIPSIPISVRVKTPPGLPDFNVSTVYRVQLNPPTVQWLPFSSFAIIKFKFSGSANTDSIAPNARFDVDQDIVLGFNPGTERLSLSPGTLSVTPHASGLGSDIVKGVVKKEVENKVKATIENACSVSQPTLDSMIGRKQELITQLQTIDEQANALVDQAVFLPDGMILRGTIVLTPRLWPSSGYEKTFDQNAFSALQSWIPGGRVDYLEWSWSWFSKSKNPGAATHDDRFLLRRMAGKVSKWGAASGLSMALPGLDGNGSVCLRIRGVQVDAVTGELVPVQSVRKCQRFGIDVSMYERPDRGRLFLYDPPELSRDVPHPQLNLRAVVAAPASSAANTLLIYSDRSLGREDAETLREGLDGTRRNDAGLVLLFLFQEGALRGERGDALTQEIEELGERIGIPVVISEDVRGAWNRAFALNGGSGGIEWRLTTPTGAVTWMHQGRLEARLLTDALDHYLIPSVRAGARPVKYGMTVGETIAVDALYTEFVEAETNCPPFPMGRAALTPTVVAFVQRGSEASDAALRRPSAQYARRAEEGPEVVIVVDGVDERETERMKNELGFDFTTLADQNGQIADQLGVRVWPTTITVDPGGVVSAVEVGSTHTQPILADHLQNAVEQGRNP